MNPEEITAVVVEGDGDSTSDGYSDGDNGGE